jgi:hypothetical protein
MTLKKKSLSIKAKKAPAINSLIYIQSRITSQSAFENEFCLAFFP